MVREPGASSRWMPNERRFGEFDPPTILSGAGEFVGLDLRANFYLQTLRATTAEAILTQGDDIAGVMNRFGAGQSILIGTFLGFSALAHRDFDADTDRFLNDLLSYSGVEGDQCGVLLRRRRVWKDQEAWFFINPTAEPVTETISLEGFTGVVDLLGDCLIAQSADAMNVCVSGTNLACILLSP